MSDIFDMMENGIPSNVDVKKNKQKIYNSPILFTTGDSPLITLIVDRNLTKNEINYLRNFLVKNNIFDFQILLSTNIDIDEDKPLNKQYIKYKWNFEKYIKSWSKIITFGRAMFSVCGTTDLDCSVKSSEEAKDKNLDKNSIIEGFYDTLLEESHFFDPSTKCLVFPVDSWDDLLNPQTQQFFKKFETSFFSLQIERLLNYNFKIQKIKCIKYDKIENPNEWLLQQIETKEKNSIVAWDLETGSEDEEGGLDPFADDGVVRCFTCSFYDNPYLGYYLNFDDIDLSILEKFLFHFKHLGSNLNFDYKWLICKKKLNINIINNLVYDTIHISQIFNTNQRNSLKSNAWVYTYYGGYDKPLEEYKEKNPICKKNYAKIPESILIPYATQDPCMSILVHQKQEQLIHEIDKKYPVTFVKDSKWSMWRFYTELRIPTQRVFTRIEINGTKVNWEKVKQLSIFLQNKIKETETKLKELLHITDDNFNLSSNDQLGLHLEKLGIKCYGRSKKNIFLVNATTLGKWKDDGYEWAKVIDEYHSLNTLYGTFVGNEKDGTGYFQYRKYDDKVHSTFGVGLNSTGRNNSKNPNLQNCFSKDTEILTEKGWISFELLQQGIKVAQYNPNNEEITFVMPLQYIKNYEETLLHIYSDKQIDLLCTKDHECLLQNRKTNKFIKVPAYKYLSDYKQITAGNYTQGTLSFTKDEIIFICALQADGYINHVNSVEFSFYKQRKSERIIQCLKNLDVDFSYKEGVKNKKLCYKIYILKTEKFYKIQNLLKYKYFDYSLLHLTPECRKLFLDEIYHWDGSFTRKNNYSSSIKLNTDIIQALFTLNNKRARQRTYYSKNPNYQLDIIKRNYALTSNHKKEEIQYNDYVYCVTVPSGNIVIRRNGKVHVTGNCPKHGVLALEIKDFFTPDNIEECAIAEADGASLQLRIEASLSRDKVMTALFQNGIDMHTLTAHFLFGQGEKFEEFDAKVKAGDKKYKTWRQSAKGPNFSLCFNTSAGAFAKTTLMEGSYKWTLEQCKEYIQLNGLENDRNKQYKYLIDKPQHGIDDIEKYSYYLTTATDIREKWLNKYIGIKNYIAFKIEEGHTYGACFTPFGFIRRVPLLKYCYGADNNKGRIKNAENIMSNVGAQTVEWVMISKSMIAVDNLIQEKQYKSKILGNVHDSEVYCLYYNEAYDIIKKAKEVFCEDIPENNNVPHELSVDLGIWGNGKDFELDELQDADTVRNKVVEKINKIRRETIYANIGEVV